MLTGTYIGEYKELHGLTAVLMLSPCSNYLAQFDDSLVTLDGVRLGFDWHLFPKNDWRIDE